MDLSSLTERLRGRTLKPAMPPATFVAVAPVDIAGRAWRFFSIAGDTPAGPLQGPLDAVVGRLPQGAAVAVIVPLSRCVVMAVDLPPLTGVKLQQALSSEMSDRLIGGAQHYAAGPVEQGRIREVASCDTLWLRNGLKELAARGLRVVQVVPEATLLPRCAVWWGALQAGQSPAWLVRAANGEAVRVEPGSLNAVVPVGEASSQSDWQWFADTACGPPPVLDDLPHCAALNAAALARRAVKAAAQWDLRQFAFAPPDGSARFMSWWATLVQPRSGRFALIAFVALLGVNLVGLNLYAMKQQRAIQARHTEMERIVTQALPDVPRLLEPATQLDAAWQRARTGSGASDAAKLLSAFAQTGDATEVTALEVSERVLRATFADVTALDRAWSACQASPVSESLRRLGVRCTREGTRLMLDFARQSTAAGGSYFSRRSQC